MVDGEFSTGTLSQILKRDLGLTLTYHQMYDYEALVDDGPGGVAKAVHQGSEDLSNASLAGMRCDEDMLDILGLGRSELDEGALAMIEGSNANRGGRISGRTLILVAPFTDFSKELAMDQLCSSCQGRGAGPFVPCAFRRSGFGLAEVGRWVNVVAATATAA